MSEQKNKTELLAPAGSVSGLKAALTGGADAVYLAGKRFGARAFAANFDEQSLKWARRVTRSLRKKLYITLNTIVFENEQKLLKETLDFYEILQPDALIVQDLGIAAELRRRKSKIPIHLSTQGTWFGQGGIKQLKELGITRVILPRETTAQEIEHIVKTSPFEIEVFVHGAMCYSVSGRCFWSISLGTRSGNRGTCAQPCRKEYITSKNKKGTFLFSPKDLRLIEEVGNLSKMGVASLKIEGRMKSPEYVYQVVSEYRKALDEGTFEQNELSEVFSRASGKGFYHGIPRVDNWKTGKTSGREGVLTAITTGKTNDGLIELLVKAPLKAGDGLFWVINEIKAGARVTYIKADKKKKDYFWVRGLPTNLGAKTELRRTSKAIESYHETMWNKDWERLPVDLFWSGHDQTPLAVEAIINEHKLRLESEELLHPALNNGLKDGPLQEKFAVLGDLYRAGRHVSTMLGDRLHLSAGALKKLKRSLVEAISKLDQLPPPQKGPFIVTTPAPDYSEHFKSESSKSEVYLKIYNNKFPFEKELPADKFIIPWFSDKEKAGRIIDPQKLAYWLPPIFNHEQMSNIQKELKTLKKGEFRCFGWEGFALAEMFPNLIFVFDWCFNVCNLSALDYIRKQKLDAVLSKEWAEDSIPDSLVAIRTGRGWNPLVSYTRFPNALQGGLTATNSHNDNFFMINIGNGCEAMFLRDKPASLNIRKNTSYQIDVAIADNENPTQVFENLNRMLS